MLKVWALCLSLILLPSCLRGCTSRKPPIHLVQDMDRQPKYLPQQESRFFYDGLAMRQPVEGTVARGQLQEPADFFTGRNPQTGLFIENPLDAHEETLDRGRLYYQIYCTPCHGDSGDGKSMMYKRSGLEATNLVGAKMRFVKDGQIFEVISNGLGLMSGYAYPIEPRDRWAIVAYVRRLQAVRR